MKRYLALFIGAVALISCLFSGCGKQPVEDTTKPPAGESSDGSALSVYVVKTDALYADAVESFQKQVPDIPLNVTTFASYKAMFDVMNVELMSKGGPDVVLYNSVKGEVDAQKLAKSGMFLPLESFTQQLDPTVYPAVLMDAGNIAGKQYFIPFSYNLLYAYTSEQFMTEKGYSTEDNLYDMIHAESEALMRVSDKSPNSIHMSRLDPVNAFFDASGICFFDKSSGEVVLDQAELQQICDFVKLVYDNTEKTKTLSSKFSNDFAGAAKSFSFITEEYPFMNNLRFYQSMFPAAADSPMVAMPYHKLNNPQELCASIVCFGGINANTKAPENAYTLLKYILDFNVSNNWSKYDETALYYAPVNLTVFQKAIDELCGSAGSGPVAIAPLAADNAEQLLENAQKITGAVIPNVSLGLSFQEILDPYFMGKDSFDNCYNTLLNKLQLYLSE